MKYALRIKIGDEQTNLAIKEENIAPVRQMMDDLAAGKQLGFVAVSDEDGDKWMIQPNRADVIGLVKITEEMDKMRAAKESMMKALLA